MAGEAVRTGSSGQHRLRVAERGYLLALHETCVRAADARVSAEETLALELVERLALGAHGFDDWTSVLDASTADEPVDGDVLLDELGSVGSIESVGADELASRAPSGRDSADGAAVDAGADTSRADVSGVDAGEPVGAVSGEGAWEAGDDIIELPSPEPGEVWTYDPPSWLEHRQVAPIEVEEPEDDESARGPRGPRPARLPFGANTDDDWWSLSEPKAG